MNPTSDSNLLFGMLALQMDFITRDQLIAGMQAWIYDKQTPLAEILVKAGVLRSEHRVLLEPLVEEHIKQHNNNPQQSLRALSSVASIKEALERLGDSDLIQSIHHIPGRGVEFNLDDTLPPLGESASKGSRFRIIRPHAKGGLGEVFVAKDTELGREVALKEIQLKYSSDTDARVRFTREAEITGGLEHPGIVPVYGLGTYPDGRPFYAMRFIRGKSLQDAIKAFHAKPESGEKSKTDTERNLELRRLLQRFIDVCEAIHYAHSRGVLHRDLKPGNIMLGRYGETLVVDWGLAKSLNDKSGEMIHWEGQPKADSVFPEPVLKASSSQDSEPTQLGSVLGTPAYMSPEQALGRIDLMGPSSDVFSLGATLYELLTGQRPYIAENFSELLQLAQQVKFPRPRSVAPSIPKPLEAICLKAMAPQSTDRYATALQLAAEIELYLGDEPITALAESSWAKLQRWNRKNKHWVQAGIFAILIVSATAIGAYFYQREGAVRNLQLAIENGNLANKMSKLAEEKGRLANEKSQLADKNLKLADEARGKAISLQQALVDNQKITDEMRSLVKEKTSLANEKSQLADNNLKLADEARDKAISLQQALADNQNITTEMRSLAQAKTTLANEKSQLADNNLKLAEEARAKNIVLQEALAENHFSHGVQEYASGRINSAIQDLYRAWAMTPDHHPLKLNYHNVLLDRATHGGRSITPPMRHDGWVHAVTFSTDGKYVATACADGIVQLWDSQTGAPIGNPIKHQLSVYDVAFSPEGDQILTGSQDHRARMWDLKTGTLIREFLTDDSVYKVAFNPRNELLLTCGSKSIQLWNARNGERTGAAIKQDVVRSVMFNSSGNLLLTGCHDHTAHLWDLKTGNTIGRPMKHNVPVLLVAFDAIADRILTITSDSTLRIWDIKTCVPISEPIHIEGANVPRAINPECDRVVLSVGNGLRLWDLKTKSYTGPLIYHEDVNDVAFNPQSDRIVTGGRDKTARIWSLKINSISKKLINDKDASGSLVALSSKGDRLLTTNGDRLAKLWDVRTTDLVREPILCSGPIRVASFNSTGDRLLIASGGDICLYDGKNGIKVSEPLKHGSDVWAASFSPAGDRILTGCDGRYAQVWDAKSGKKIGKEIAHTGPVHAVAFNPQGDRILTTTRKHGEDVVQFWDAMTGEPVGASMHPGGFVQAVAFSPDGDRFVTGCMNNIAQIWDVKTWKPIGETMRHDINVWSVAFSPTGEQLLTSTPREWRRWDARTGAALGEPNQPESLVFAVAFTGDGERVLTGSWDGVRMWKISKTPFPKDLSLLMQLHTGNISLPNASLSPKSDPLILRSSVGSSYGSSASSTELKKLWNVIEQKEATWLESLRNAANAK